MILQGRLWGARWLAVLEVTMPVAARLVLQGTRLGYLAAALLVVAET